jgi:hypothetical protein
MIDSFLLNLKLDQMNFGRSYKSNYSDMHKDLLEFCCRAILSLLYKSNKMMNLNRRRKTKSKVDNLLGYCQEDIRQKIYQDIHSLE